MPNILDANGLQVASRQELTDYFNTMIAQIYGPDINLASDTPDGQFIGLLIQAILDYQDLLVQIYNTFDPDNAVGVVLDQRVAINGIQRQAGTFTTTNITVVTSQSVNLFGLDQTQQEVFTVSDNAGNLWQLQVTQLGVSTGTNVFVFQAAVPGAQLTVPNTINVPVTIVLGVVSVNNPTTYLTLGVNEESDAVLKVRRQRSVSLASQGYLAGLLAALQNIPGVTSAFVYENVTDSVDVDGIPGHSIWVIVAGTGTDADIAQAIYTKRNAGCGMKGSISYTIIQVDGNPFVVQWDTVTQRTLFVFFTATSLNGVVPPDVQTIREELPNRYTPGVNTEVNINGLATIVQQIDANTLVTDAGFSLGTTQKLNFSGIAASGSFIISYAGNASAAINWDDGLSTIQGKVEAITGLSAVVVSGSIASKQLSFDLSGLSDVTALLITPSGSNSLMTSAPAAITIALEVPTTPTLLPPTKINQLVVSSDNIVILDIVMLPSTVSVAATHQQQFAAYGGYGTYTYAISVNNSGGTIDSSTGLYTAGATPMVSDTILVTDELGNTMTSTVSVVTG